MFYFNRKGLNRQLTKCDRVQKEKLQLKWANLKNRVKMWIHWLWIGQSGFCKYGNEHTGFIQAENIFIS
jgi:hypothetical protein